MSIDIKSAAEAPLVDGDLVWGSDVAETGVKVMTDVVGRTATQTLTNKTLTAPVIATINNGGILTLPSSVTDTLVGKATVDTLTNKTINSATLNNAILQGSTLITSASIVTSTIQTPTFSTYGIYTLGSIAASVTDAQGEAPMTLEVNVVTVGGADYAATLPTAVAGRYCTVVNNSTNRLKVYPFSGDDAGGGTNAAVFIAGGQRVTFLALDATNWVTAAAAAGIAKQSSTLAAAATTLAIYSDLVVLTGDGGGNTLSTITGGVTGQKITLLFVDANVAITDTAAHTTDTVDLSAAFTSADDTILQLIYDGTSWYETSRSVN
jgi:hypothetical protein